MWKSGVGLFIGNSHHQAWGCLLAIRTIRRGAVYWQFATSGVGLFIGNSHHQAWGCLLAIRTINCQPYQMILVSYHHCLTFH